MLLTTNTTIDKITSYVSQMTENEAALERRQLMARAVKLNQSINKKLKIGVADIVREINNIREENPFQSQI
jgi:hypothetical protein